MARKNKGERRIYVSFELDNDGHPNAYTIQLNTCLKDLTPYLKTHQRTYLGKKMKANRNKPVKYKEMYYLKKKF